MIRFLYRGIIVARYKKEEWSGAYQKIMVLAEQGATQKEIAAATSKSTSRISQILRSKKFRERREKFHDQLEGDIYEKFAKYSMRAAQKIVDIMRTGKGKDRIQLDAAKDVLNYAGHKPKERHETVTYNYSIHEVRSAKEAMQEVVSISTRLTREPSKFLLTSEDKEKSLEEDIHARALKTSGNRQKA